MAERDYRQIVSQLRAKAESTTFPAEAESLRAKADEIERAHGVNVARPPADDLRLLIDEAMRQRAAWPPARTGIFVNGRPVRVTTTTRATATGVFNITMTWGNWW